MDVSEWQDLPAWICRNCGHHELEAVAYKIAGEPKIDFCWCYQCVLQRKERPAAHIVEATNALHQYFGEPVMRLSQFCDAMETWARCIIDNNVNPDLIKDPTNPDRQQGHQYFDFLRGILTDIRKSGLLSRLLYDGQKLRTKMCPTHKGHMATSIWVGMGECPDGCEGTGWLPEPEDKPTEHKAVTVVTVRTERSK